MARAEHARLQGRLRGGWHALVRTARLMVGVPDYQHYLAHMQQQHPECTPMDRASFFRERMDARYGKGRSRCC